MNGITANLYQRAQDLSKPTICSKQSMDMLKAIQTYRTFPSLQELLKYKPQLVNQLDELYSLWSRFNSMSDEELSELAMSLINESL